MNFLMTIGVDTTMPKPEDLAPALPEGGFSWAWALLILLVIYAAALVIFFLYSRSKKK